MLNEGILIQSAFERLKRLSFGDCKVPSISMHEKSFIFAFFLVLNHKLLLTSFNFPFWFFCSFMTRVLFALKLTNNKMYSGLKASILYLACLWSCSSNETKQILPFGSLVFSIDKSTQSVIGRQSITRRGTFLLWKVKFLQQQTFFHLSIIIIIIIIRPNIANAIPSCLDWSH